MGRSSVNAVKDQLAETREEISRVDGKASIVLAGVGFAVGVVIAGLLAGGDRLLHQLLRLSRVVASKYNCLRWGIRLLGAAIPLAIGAGILHLIVG